eukprot:6173596-Pleurochrysis_carterae.AAC.1
MQQYQEYSDDLKAAGAESEIVSRTWFGHIFRVSPKLADIGIASGKENFGRCTICGDLEETIRKARYSRDAQLLLQKKQERFDHIKRERADKLAYYSHRYAFCSKCASVVLLPMPILTVLRLVLRLQNVLNFSVIMQLQV